MELKNVIVKIRNKIIFNCKYYLDEKTKISYIYHNISSISNYYPNEKYGYKYAYTYSNRYIFSNPTIIHGDFKEVKYDDNLLYLEEVTDLNLIYLFNINNGRFKDYNELSLTKEGLIKISNSLTKKTLEIKVGRFVRALLDDNKDFIIANDLLNFNEINSSVLEKITNGYKKFANTGKFVLEIVKGEDILKGYTKSNYMIDNNSSSLAKSCMTDHYDYLELYTKNSNVELAILYLLDKVIARCLVWKSDNEKFFDTIYNNYEWAKLSLEDELTKLGIKKAELISTPVYIKLDYIPEYYPYVDTFYNLNTINKVLCNYDWDSISDKRLLDAEGGYIIPGNDEDEDDYEDEE